MPRQQTLRSLIDWSYDLLNDPEKLLLQRLSVFAGGWTFETAEQVCAGEGVEDWEVLDRLTSLSDKSLVVAEQQEGHSRYRLLETVRQYAQERLVESGGGAAIRERHRDYFLALAEEAEPKLSDAEQAEWLQRLDSEHENLRAALGWSLEAAQFMSGLRLCGALQQFWWTRGHLAEGREWCVRFLEKVGGEAQTPERAKVLNVAGVLAHYQADYPAARARLEESLAIKRQLGDRKGIAGSLDNLGNVAVYEGDYPAARLLHEESLAIERELGERRGVARSLNNLGNVALYQGDYPAARSLYEESLAIARKLGNRSEIARALRNLGNVAYNQDDHAAARGLYVESLAIRRELRDRGGIASSLTGLGAVAHDQGDFPAAIALYQEGLVIQRALGDGRGIAFSLEGLATLVAALGSSLRAARIWGTAERLRVEIGSPLPPIDRPRYDRRVGATRAAMGDDAAFDRAWQEGRILTIEQAIELALAQTIDR